MVKSKLFENILESCHKVTVIPSVEVTPELASELLTLNTSNRPLNTRYLKTLIREMKRGHWKFNGDLIRISKTAKLLDAQHRLHGVVEAGTPQTFNIQLGLEDETYNTIDNGRQRTAGDIVYHLGYDNYNATASAVRLITAYETGVMSRESRSFNKRGAFTNKDIADWLGNPENSEKIQDCMQLATKFYHKNFILTVSQIAAFLYLFAKRDEDAAREFMQKLLSGQEMTDADDIILKLREKLIAMKLSKQYSTTGEKFALIIKTWNYWRTGKQVNRLVFTAGEQFPEIK